jgi:hypothetical protein
MAKTNSTQETTTQADNEKRTQRLNKVVYVSTQLPAQDASHDTVIAGTPHEAHR